MKHSLASLPEEHAEEGGDEADGEVVGADRAVRQVATGSLLSFLRGRRRRRQDRVVVRKLLVDLGRSLGGLSGEEGHQHKRDKRERQLEETSPRVTFVVEPRVSGQRPKDHVPEGRGQTMRHVVGSKVVVEMVATSRLEEPRAVVRVESDVHDVHDDLADRDTAVDGVSSWSSEEVDKDHDRDAVVDVDGDDGRGDDAQVAGPLVVVVVGHVQDLVEDDPVEPVLQERVDDRPKHCVVQPR